MAPPPVLLPGKSHGWRSLVGCSPWGREESNTTERLHFHFSLSCVGEGNGNPLQCSCLENPRVGGAWWASVYGVAQSWTWLKRLSSSNRGIYVIFIYRHTMEILQFGFRSQQYSRYHNKWSHMNIFDFPVHIKIMCTLHCNPLNVQQHHV